MQSTLEKKYSRRWFNIRALMNFFIAVSKKPFITLLLGYCVYAAINISYNYSSIVRAFINLDYAFQIINIFQSFIFFWLVLNLVNVSKTRLLVWAEETNNTTVSILLPAISSSLQTLVILTMVNLFAPALDLSGVPAVLLDKSVKVLMILMFGWVFFQIVNAVERFITKQYILQNTNAFTARKIHTQLLILKRVILAILVVIILAAILMLFDTVKNLGTGLLTTAGIISAIGAFASQQSLSRLFAGLLIAFTQPIRIGDTVIIDNEFGQIEEITLSYIVVKLWDLRRLILPTDYFTSKGLQNLTRESSQLLGTIFIYADYTLPVETVREKFMDLLKTSTSWDQKVAAFHVTDIKENTMELRGLMSAEDSSKLWELRCEIREKLMDYIVKNFPECLSKSRNLTTTFLDQNRDPSLMNIKN